MFHTFELLLIGGAALSCSHPCKCSNAADKSDEERTKKLVSSPESRASMLSDILGITVQCGVKLSLLFSLDTERPPARR
jgi:hypothetical protein